MTHPMHSDACKCECDKLAERIRKLHEPVFYGISTQPDCSHCKSECLDYSSDTDTVPYPCPTIQALDDNYEWDKISEVVRYLDGL